MLCMLQRPGESLSGRLRKEGDWGHLGLIQLRLCQGVSGLLGVAHPSWILPPASLPLIKAFSLPEPVPGPEPFRKKEVVEILSHKKAYNTCEGLGSPRGCGGREAALCLGHRALDPLMWMTH